MIIEYIDGKRTLNFGRYKVVTEKQDFNAVYQYSYQGDKLLIHKSTWKQATKIAHLLQQAYQEGYDEAEFYWRD